MMERPVTQEWQLKKPWTHNPAYQQINHWVYENFFYSDGPRPLNWGQRYGRHHELFRLSPEHPAKKYDGKRPDIAPWFNYPGAKLSESELSELFYWILKWRSGAFFEALTKRQLANFKSGALRSASMIDGWDNGEFVDKASNALDLLEARLIAEGNHP